MITNPSHIYLAPLQGLTALPFRKAYSKTFPNTIDVAVSPFISLTHGDLTSSAKKLNDVLPFQNKDSLPVIPQILGKETEQFIQLANRLHDLGYEEVNWNLGCPVSRVVRKKRGSGLLPYPDEIDQILEKVHRQLKNRLSIKMRLGYEAPNEIFRLIPILNKYPLSSVCIHPRLGIQMYEGCLHLDVLSSCLPLLKHKVIFNGDICNVEDYHHIKKQFSSISDFMIGRGVLRNPFLPSNLKDIYYSNPVALFQEFEQALLQEIITIPSLEKSKLNKMKEYWYYLSTSFQNAEEVLNKVVSTQTIFEYETAIQSIFKEYNLLGS